MLVQSLQSAPFSMEDNYNFAANLCHDSFDSGSLSGFHTTWLDDDHLNNPPLTDSFTDVSPSMEKTTNPSVAFNSTLCKELVGHDAPLSDTALDFTFDSELSSTLEPFIDATAAMSPLELQQRQTRSPKPRKTTNSLCKRKKTGMTPRQDINIDSNWTNELEVPAVEFKRQRFRGSSWPDQEKNTFFTMFKVKWPPTPEGKSTLSFSSLLLQRFDAISTKIQTKSMMEVRQFYTTVMHNVSELLEVVENDIDLTNLDQVRIAVWCWSKLMADKKHLKEFESLSSDSSTKKTCLANLLLQSIIRSRRQMLKAKSDSENMPAPSLTSISAWVARSNISSICNRPTALVQDVQVHHPMVRKKQKQVLAVTKNVKKDLPIVHILPKRVNSAIVCDRSLIGTKAHCANVKSMAFTSPAPMDKRSRSRTQNGVACHAPQQFRKKIYIKMRMIPRDKQTKVDVVHCGCRPKVELKLSSTKKISEITAHMSKKWANVHSLVPKGAVLCFFRKYGTEKWSIDDSNVTCFDIWKLCGKQSNGENVVEVSYKWQLPSETCESDQDQHLVPLTLFDDVSAAGYKAIRSSGESEVLQLSHACSQQKLCEHVAFDRSITGYAENEAAPLRAYLSDSNDEDFREEYSPISGHLRRRIQPVLVLKEEFNL